MAASVLARHLLTAVQLRERLTRDFTTTSIKELDALVEGFPRAAVTEIAGTASSGRATVAGAALAGATARGECCAIVDGSNSFDPQSAAAGGVDLSRLLWVRCGGSVEDAMRCADLLLHAAGWGMVVLDLAGLPGHALRRLPMSWWYRFRQAAETSSTALLVIADEPVARASAALALTLEPASPVWAGRHSAFRRLEGSRVCVQARKPVRRHEARFDTRAIA